MAEFNPLKELSSFLAEVTEAHARSEAILEHKRTGLTVAINSKDDKQIEAARLEVIEAFSASVDEYIRMNRKLESLKTRALDGRA